MKHASEWLSTRIARIPISEKYAFVGSLVFGLLAHLFILSNSLIYHDAAVVEMGNPDATFTSGRWGLGILSWLSDLVGVTSHSSMFDGVLSILFIAIAGMIVVSLLDIKSILGSLITGFLLVSFPSVTGTFSFMFTAPYYFFAFLLTALALKLVVDGAGFPRFAAGVLLLAFAIGVYQANMSIALALGFSVALIDYVYKGDSLQKSFKMLLKLLCLIAIGTLLYLCINRVIIDVTHLQVTSYQGMDSAGVIDLKALPVAIINCYKTFVKMKWESSLYSDGINNSLLLRFILIALSFIAVLVLILDTIRKWKRIRYVILTILFILLAPFAMNSIFVMSTDEEYIVHTLMMYSLVIYLVLLLSIFEQSGLSSAIKCVRLRDVVNVVIAACFVTLPISYCYLDNVAYYRMSLVQSEMDSWFTVLVSEIKGCDGYKDELPIAFIGNPGLQDSSIYSYPRYGVGIVGFAYDVPTLTSAYDWIDNMEIHTGFSPDICSDIEPLKESEEVKNMPCYPDHGSIKVIDNAVVVKFSQ